MPLQKRSGEKSFLEVAVPKVPKAGVLKIPIPETQKNGALEESRLPSAFVKAVGGFLSRELPKHDPKNAELVWQAVHGAARSELRRQLGADREAMPVSRSFEHPATEYREGHAEHDPEGSRAVMGTHLDFFDLEIKRVLSERLRARKTR